MSSSSTKFGRIAWNFAWGALGRSFQRSAAPHSFDLKFTFSQYRVASQRHVRRHCSGGLLLLGLDTTTASPTQTIVSTCSTAADSAIAGSNSRTGRVSRLAAQAWARSVHTFSGSAGKPQRRFKSTDARSQENANKVSGKETQKTESPNQKVDPEHLGKTNEHGQDSLTESVSKYLHLPHLPKMPHRPTKEELLAAATGFTERLKVRFKWFSIRSTRPFNADEWGAFVSWILFGHFVWILVGTTTFVSLLILTVNTVFAQGMPPSFSPVACCYY